MAVSMEEELHPLQINYFILRILNSISAIFYRGIHINFSHWTFDLVASSMQIISVLYAAFLTC